MRLRVLRGALFAYALVHFSLLAVGTLIAIGNLGVFSTNVLILIGLLILTTAPSALAVIGLNRKRGWTRLLVLLAGAVAIIIGILTAYLWWTFNPSNRDPILLVYSLLNIGTTTTLLYGSLRWFGSAGRSVPE